MLSGSTPEGPEYEMRLSPLGLYESVDVDADAEGSESGPRSMQLSQADNGSRLPLAATIGAPSAQPLPSHPSSRLSSAKLASRPPPPPAAAATAAAQSPRRPELHVSSALEPTAPPVLPNLGGGCDVADVLRGLLTAAARLASLGGIHMIVQAPLIADVPTGTAARGAAAAAAAALGPGSGTHRAAPPSRSGGGGRAAGGPASRTLQAAPNVPTTSGESAALRPRPLRRISADVPSMVLRRIASYILDISLQCTPQVGG